MDERRYEPGELLRSRREFRMRSSFFERKIACGGLVRGGDIVIVLEVVDDDVMVLSSGNVGCAFQDLLERFEGAEEIR